MANITNINDSERLIEGLAKTAATIGSSVTIKGEIAGEEDIIIHGQVEGTVNLKKNIVVVAKSGKVHANIYGQVIHVEGEVLGDLLGSEQIVLHGSASVRGNITTPRITMESGARVKGAIDTDMKGEGAVLLKDAEVLRASKNEDTVIGEAITPKNGRASSSAAQSHSF